MALPESDDRPPPYHADSIRADYLVPTRFKLGLGRVGCYTFCRSISSPVVAPKRS